MCQTCVVADRLLTAVCPLILPGALCNLSSRLHHDDGGFIERVRNSSPVFRASTVTPPTLNTAVKTSSPHFTNTTIQPPVPDVRGLIFSSPPHARPGNWPGEVFERMDGRCHTPLMHSLCHKFVPHLLLCAFPDRQCSSVACQTTMLRLHPKVRLLRDEFTLDTAFHQTPSISLPY